MALREAVVSWKLGEEPLLEGRPFRELAGLRVFFWVLPLSQR